MAQEVYDRVYDRGFFILSTLYCIRFVTCDHDFLFVIFLIAFVVATKCDQIRHAIRQVEKYKLRKNAKIHILETFQRANKYYNILKKLKNKRIC